MDKRRIDFAAVGQEITFSVADPVPRGDTQQYLTAHFSVDETWAGLSLQAVFQRKGRGFSPVTVSLDESMACDFPASLLAAPEGGGTVYIRVGLIGTDTQGKRLTTGCAAVPIAPSCYVRGETPKDPPQDVYTKLLGAIGAKLDANQGAENVGKVLGIGNDGAVSPVDIPAGGGGVAEETDPTVPAWAKQPEKPTYTADEVGAIPQNQLEGAVNLALAEAKTTGMFDGAQGPQGPQGDPYTLTGADKAEIAAAVIESLGGNPVFGYVDEDNNIIVHGDLADGTYSVKYEMEDGSAVNIGDLVLDTNVYYSVTNTLTNCVNSNSAKQIAAGESYAATITANDGYALSSVTVTLGGVDVTASAVSGGNISIASVTGDIVITAGATEIVVTPTYTNLFVPSAATLNQRVNSSNVLKETPGHVVTGFIDVRGKVPFTSDTKIYVKGANFDPTSTGNYYTKVWTTKETTPPSDYSKNYSALQGSNFTATDEGSGVISISGDNIASSLASGVTYMVLVLRVNDSNITESDIQNIVITIDEPIV